MTVRIPHVVFTAVPVVSLIPSVLQAHVPSGHAHSQLGVSFPLVLVISSVMGALGASAILFAWPREFSLRWGHRMNTLMGLVLIVLAAWFVYPTVLSSPFVTAGGVFLGAIVGSILPRSHSHDPVGHLPDVTFGSVLVHRMIEGVSLAAAALSGTVIGWIAVVIITVHSIAETGVVSVFYATIGRRRRALLAVLLVQTGYALAAIVSLQVALDIMEAWKIGLMGVLAGVLFLVGGRECIEKRPSQHEANPEGEIDA